jgi:Ca2+-binding EF-hand superfamily protein
MLKETINESKAKFLESSDELYGATFDMFATGETMNAQQMDTALTLILPKSAEEKFNQIWALVDTDGDGKITEEEMKAFINKAVDMVIAIGHFTINLYKTLGESLAIKIATVCIEAKDPNGLTLEQTGEILEEAPEYAMKCLMPQ